MSDLKISARATFDLSEIVSGAATARAELSSLGAAAGAGGRAAAAGLGQVTTTMAAVQSAAHATAQSITSEMTAAGQTAGRQVAAGMAQTTAAMSGASSAAASAAQSIQSQFSTAAAQAAAAMQASQAAIQAAMRSAAQAAGDTARATQDIRLSVERGTAATQQMAGQLNSAVGAASSLVKTLGGLYVVNQAVDKLSELPKIGVASAANMEVMQLGMAGTLASMGKIEGKSIDIAQAQQIAKQIAEKLQVKALETAASTKDLVGAYQALLGPALAAKMSLNQLIELTVVGVNAVKSMGLPTQQVIQEMRDLVAGGIQASSSTLATAIGVTDKDIAKIKRDGGDLFKFLMDRLSGFAASSVLYGDTLTGKFDALKESIELTAQQGFAPLTDALKIWIAEISASFGKVETVSVKVGDTFKETQKWSIDPAVVTQLRSAADAIVDAGDFALSAARAVYEYRGAVEALAVAWLAVKASQAVGAGAAAVGEFASRIAAEGAAAAAALRTAEADAAAAGMAARRAVVERELAMVELGRAQATEAVAAADVAAAVGATELAAANARLAAATASRSVATEQAALATQAMNGSNVAAATSTQALAVAQANAARATTAAGLAMRAGGGIIAALGGPIGIAITALGALAFAFFNAGSEAEKAAARSAKAVSDIRAALQKKNRVEAQRLIQEKDAEIAAQGDLLDAANRGAKDNAPNITESKRWKDLVGERSKRLGELRNQRMSMKEELDEWDKVQSQSGKSLPAVTAKFDTAATNKLDDLREKTKSKADKLKEDLDFLKNQVKAGIITADEAEKLEKKLRKKEAGSARASTAAGLTAPDRALADLQARVDAEKTLGEQLAKTGLAQEKLTEGEKLAIKYRQELAAATTKVKKEELERLAKKADELAAQQKQNAAAKEVLTLNQEFARSAAQRALDLQQINEEAVKEVEWLGLSTEARAVAQAQWELEKQTRREILALQEKMAAAASAEGKAVIAAEIERVRAAASEKSTAVAAATAAKTASSEAARMSQDIERALTDSLMRGFDNGKGAIKSLKDYAVNAFKGWTVKIALKPVMGQVNQVAQQLSASVSNAMKSGGGLQNLTPSNIIGDKAFGGIGKMSIGDAMGSWYPSDMLQSFSQSGVGELFELSDAAGSLTQAGADLTAGAANMADLAGSVGSWVSVGIDAFNSFKTGEGWGKTVGSAIGTYILPGIGTAIGSTLGGMIDDAFGGKGGPKAGGNANAIYTADGQAVAREIFGGYTPDEMDSAFKTAVDGIQAQYATMVKSLGGVAKDLTINLGGDTDPKGNAGNRISAQIAVGQVGAGMGSADAERALWGASAYSKVSASAGGDLTQAVKEESARMLVAALKVSDLPADIATAFNSIDVQTASIEQVNAALTAAQGIMALSKVFDQFATVLPGIGNLSLTAKNRLISLSGGLDALSNNLASYQGNYFSAQEREDAARAAINKTLADANVKMPQTRAEFRQLLDGLDKTTDAGSRAAAALLSVNSQFAAITLSTEDQDKLTAKFKALQGVLPNLASASTTAQLSMLKSAGGLDNLAGQLDKFSESFVSQKSRESDAYAEAERVLKSLGQQMPLTQQGFVEIVRGYKLTTSEGVAAVSALLGVSGTIAQMTASAEDINKLGTAFGGLERLMPSLSGLTTEAQLQLSKFAGGIDSLANSLSSFKSNYFTKAELERDTLKGIETDLAKVGISLPKTRDEFKALVEKYSTTSGDFAKAALAALLSVQDRFASVTQSSDDLAVAASSASTAVQDFAQTIKDEFERAAAAAGQTLAKLKEATASRNEVDQWLAMSQGQGAAWQAARSKELWGMVQQAASPEQQLELLQEIKLLTYERYKTEIDSVVELTRNASRLRDAARSIRDYVQSLKTGELSPRTMGERLAEAGAQFSITLAQAKSGDKNAIDQIQGKAQAYLQLGQSYYGSSEGYAGQNGIFNNVTSALDALGISMDSMAAGQDLAAAQAEAQARYSAAQIAEMQRLRTAFSSVETALRDQFVQQSNTAAQILAKMRDDDQLAALRALPAELAELIKGAWVAQGGGSAGPGTAFGGGATTAVPATPTVTQPPPAAAGGTGGVSTIKSYVAPSVLPDAVVPSAVDELRNTVSGWYMAYLGRPGDSTGIDYWVSQAQAGGADATYQTFAANAAVEKEVGSIYAQVLHRMPDQAGWAYWIDQVKSGMSYAQVAAALAASDEVKSSLPQFAVGAERLPSDMVAQLHAGEAVIPAWANTRMLDAVERGAGAPAGGGGDLAGLRAEVQQLREVTERQALMIERLLSALGRAVLDSSADNADRIVDGVAAAGQIDNWRAGARRPALA